MSEPIQSRKAWQHVQQGQAAFLDAMRVLDEKRSQMTPGQFQDCERLLDEAYRAASRAQGYLLIAERNAEKGTP